MGESRDKGDAAYDVAEESREEETCRVIPNRDFAERDEDEDVGGTGDDVIEAADTDDVGDDEDDENAGRRGIGHHPDHERDEPAGENGAQDDDPESGADVSGGDFDHGALDCWIEEMDASDK